MIEETPLSPGWKRDVLPTQASIAFLHRVQELPGIRAIRSINAPDGSSTGVVVYVHSRHSQESDRIYDALFEIEDLYPGSELDISISEAEPSLDAENASRYAATS